MRLYWKDREGKSAPPNACFGKIPFEKSTPTFFQPTLVDLPAPTRAKILKRTFSPTKEEWIKNIRKAKALPKVVLARKCTLILDHAPDPFAITASLKAQGAFVFCLETENGAFFRSHSRKTFQTKRPFSYQRGIGWHEKAGHNTS